MERLKQELDAMVKEFEVVKATREQMLQKANEFTARLVQLQGSYATLKKLIEEKGGTVEDPVEAPAAEQEVPAKEGE